MNVGVVWVEWVRKIPPLSCAVYVRFWWGEMQEFSDEIFGRELGWVGINGEAVRLYGEGRVGLVWVVVLVVFSGEKLVSKYAVSLAAVALLGMGGLVMGQATTGPAGSRPASRPVQPPPVHPEPIPHPGYFSPGALWPDDRGKHIQAHGGGVVKFEGMYYWYGEYRGQDLPAGEPVTRGVGCYASKDLLHWEFKGRVFETNGVDDITTGLVLERPKVYFNEKTKKFVMYMHIDSHDYRAARVGTAIADRPEGPYKFLRSWRPLGEQSRDIGQFIDDDGTAYLIFEDRAHGFHIARLSEDYLDVVESVALIKAPIEGGAVVKYEGLYYCVGSALTGWRANPNKYATAKSLAGPWSEWKDIAPPEKRTYGSQSTNIVKVVGSKQTTVIFLGDIWRPQYQYDSRYLWMPLKIGDGKLELPEPRPWKLNVETGEVEWVEAKGEGTGGK